MVLQETVSFLSGFKRVYQRGLFIKGIQHGQSGMTRAFSSTSLASDSSVAALIKNKRKIKTYTHLVLLLRSLIASTPSPSMLLCSSNFEYPPGPVSR